MRKPKFERIEIIPDRSPRTLTHPGRSFWKGVLVALSITAGMVLFGVAVRLWLL
jgi:hypothetical protein